MFIQKIFIHNFRSVIDAEINLEKYSILVGENNSGKSNIITALRIFYEDDIKFNSQEDFPKCKTNDNESWIELWFVTSADEQLSLKAEYRANDGVLKVRKYFKSDNPELVKANQSNIYAYESGILSNNLFYGAKNISNAKLGNVIFIPEISKTDENLKMSGPSTLRNMIDFVMQKVIKESKTFVNLQSAFEVFNNDFKYDSSIDGFSLNELTSDINSNISDWGITFGLEINQITTDNIIKNLISHYIQDSQLEGQKVSASCFGQGLQRHLIYTLIRVGAKYTTKNPEKKKDFSPDFSLILFEEPEVFLHPSQQEFLNNDLLKLSEDPRQQIICSTHSSVFVSKNIESLSSMVRLDRRNGKTNVFQIRKNELDDLYNENNSLYKMFSKKLLNPDTPDNIKHEIKRRNLGSADSNEEQKIEEESLKYSLWLDKERSCSFFAKQVIICEGATEKSFFDYLIDTEWLDFKNMHLYFLDALGKYNIHRYMNLFDKLGIPHSVIFDKDRDSGIHKLINDFLKSKRNNNTRGFYCFENEIEDFVGIKKMNSSHLKPINMMWNFKNGLISEEKIVELKRIIEGLIIS